VLNIVSPVLSVAVLPRRPLKDSRTVTAREEDEKVLNGKGNDEDGQEDEQERNQQQLVVLSYRGLHHFVGPIQLPPFLLPITNIPVVPGDS
jgi:hypothetical protein